mmetsp:Transcript_4437/g.16975  ORF Transcript_4437/g.16975 Transcript_4437/m.16975 type:complete len:237 (+) Transcript_4437:443-1153(+)
MEPTFEGVHRAESQRRDRFVHVGVRHASRLQSSGARAKIFHEPIRIAYFTIQRQLNEFSSLLGAVEKSIESVRFQKLFDTLCDCRANDGTCASDTDSKRLARGFVRRFLVRDDGGGRRLRRAPRGNPLRVCVMPRFGVCRRDIDGGDLVHRALNTLFDAVFGELRFDIHRRAVALEKVEYGFGKRLCGQVDERHDVQATIARAGCCVAICNSALHEIPKRGRRDADDVAGAIGGSR